MCGSGITRRDFIRLSAAGSALLWLPAGVRPLDPHATPLPATPLDLVLGAERWIRASRVETRHGITWPVAPGHGDAIGPNDMGDVSLYHGSPGVILFLLGLHQATRDPAALTDAQAGADHLLAVIADGRVATPGLYTGLAGVAYALERVHAATGAARFRDGATGCIDRIVGAARPDRGGLTWHSGDADQASTDIISGAAGIGCTLLWAHERLGHTAAFETAVEAGRWLSSVAEEAPGGLRWRITQTFERNYPNFSHGAGGVGFFLARLYGRTGFEWALDASVRAAGYLETASTCRDGGCAIFHHEPGGEELYYLGWCHGPAGTSRLFHELATVTRDTSWHSWTDRGARAIVEFGVPETRSPGYWNNVSQCGGDAGVGDFFLAQTARTGDETHARFAERIGDWLSGRTDDSDDDHASWTQAEHRVQPENLQAQTGWMQGAAGVGAFLLHLDGRAAGRRAEITLPDSPWHGMI